MTSDYTKSETPVYTCATTGHYVVPYPTGNCQIFCIADACNILSRIPASQDSEKEVKVARKVFIESGIVTDRKKLCLIDVQSYYISYVEMVFQKYEIVVKNEYLSTNGSNMCIFIIKIPYGGYY